MKEQTSTLFTPNGTKSESKSGALEALQSRSRGVIALQNFSGVEGPCHLFFNNFCDGSTLCTIVETELLSQMIRGRLLKYFAWGLLFIVLTGGATYCVCKRTGKPLLAMRTALQSVGHGDFDTPVPHVPYNDEIGDLSLALALMQKELADHATKLSKSRGNNERLEGELNAARKIQQDILPHTLPPMDGFTNVAVVSSLNTARGVGGDLYDAFPSDSEHMGLVIGDVSGKGIPAALFMAVTQTLQRSLVRTEDLPDTLAEQMNRMLAIGNEANMFVTWWCGFLDIRNGDLVYTNAGHNPPLIRRQDGSLEILSDLHGPPLAALHGCQYSFSRTKLNEGDILILYTDGVTEAFNADDEMFGENRLIETVKRINTDEPKLLLECISKSLSEFTNGVEQSDDITILVAKYTAPNDIGHHMSIHPSLDNLSLVMAFAESIPEVNRLGGRERNLLLVSIEEVFCNLVKYGTGNNRHIDDIVIFTGVFDMHRQIRIRFTENGPPFNPLDTPYGLSDAEGEYATLGSGIVRTWMDYVDYQYQDGRNILTVGKIIDAT
ncbi:MAG: SpoIIE family protein phosphatase [Planctomycetia bacterium]|nr:SpoIIE family protein phosphatase [Planctomycetia bacterium]